MADSRKDRAVRNGACNGCYQLGLLLAPVSVLLYAAAILFGELNQDEGWYLYAGRLVSEGRHPFLDFASTQGPVMAYVYSLAYPLVRLGGVAGGRLFTALAGLLTVVLAAGLARRMAQAGKTDGAALAPAAALLTAGLLGLNLYQVYFTSLVKTYSVAGLLAVLGFLGLERALQAADRQSVAGGTAGGYGAAAFGGLAGICFAVAAGTRLSAGVLLPAVWLPLAGLWLRTGRRRGTGLVLAGMLAGGTAAMAAVYGPFLLWAPDALAFGLLDYHAGRQVGGVSLLLAYKAGFLLRLCAFYFPVIVVGAVALAGYRPSAAGPVDRSMTPRLPVLMAAGLAAVTLVHLAAPFPYDDYQVFIMPCAVLLTALPAVRLLFRLPLTPVRRGVVLAGTLLLILAHSLASPLPQAWLTAGRDRIWWPLRTQTHLQGLRRAAAVVRRQASEIGVKTLLLTQDTYLAVEADMRVPDGMELGPFCFFPGLSDAEAARYHVLNESLLQAEIESGAAALAAFSGWGLAISAPAIRPVDPETAQRLEMVLRNRYETVLQIEKFGQGETPLRILKWRTQP